MLLLLFGLLSYSQDVPAVYELKTDEIDEFTGKLKKTSNLMGIGEDKLKNRLIVYFNKRADIKDSITNERYYLNILTYGDLGCSGVDKNYVMIKFDNDDVIKLENDISKINCKTSATSRYKLDGEILAKLKLNNIQSIRLRQSEHYSDFNIFYPDFFINTIQLLDN